MTTNIFHDFKVMFIQLNEATNHTVHISNHGALSTLNTTVRSFEETTVQYETSKGYMCTQCNISQL